MSKKDVLLTLLLACNKTQSDLISSQLTALCKKATIHQLTIMLATSKNVPLLGMNHLLTTSADDPTL